MGAKLLSWVLIYFQVGLESMVKPALAFPSDRSEIATLNRPFLRGRGAAASTLNGSARQWDTEFGTMFLR